MFRLFITGNIKIIFHYNIRTFKENLNNKRGCEIRCIPNQEIGNEGVKSDANKSKRITVSLTPPLTPSFVYTFP